ncbi:hypothetical protein [Vibrio phage LV6]|nr:hypothetical protein [Vibrio phage LV6]
MATPIKLCLKASVLTLNTIVNHAESYDSKQPETLAVIDNVKVAVELIVKAMVELDAVNYLEAKYLLELTQIKLGRTLLEHDLLVPRGVVTAINDTTTECVETIELILNLLNEVL